MRHSALRLTLVLIAAASLAACEKRSGEAVVLGKEHIDAVVQSATPDNVENESGPVVRPMRDDEITVDSYVMKREVRGTGRDPRALKDEQWLVKVRMISDSRVFNVPAEKAQFENLNDGDGVQVNYRVGKYTKTVWGAEITAINK